MYRNVTMKQAREKKPFVALYGLFFEYEDGTIVGFTEHSFSMNWNAHYVRLWDLESAQRYLDSHIAEAKGKNVNGRYFILRLTRRGGSGRIRADFGKRNRDYAKNGGSYLFRNVSFTVDGKYQDAGGQSA
jgi:hypothetical protein